MKLIYWKNINCKIFSATIQEFPTSTAPNAGPRYATKRPIQDPTVETHESRLQIRDARSTQSQIHITERATGTGANDASLYARLTTFSLSL